MVSLQSSVFKDVNVLGPPEDIPSEKEEYETKPAIKQEVFLKHKWWDHGKGWKNMLHHLRLIVQPHVCYCLLYGWLEVFALPFLKGGLMRLMALMHDFQGFVPV